MKIPFLSNSWVSHHEFPSELLRSGWVSGKLKWQSSCRKYFNGLNRLPIVITVSGSTYLEDSKVFERPDWFHQGSAKAGLASAYTPLARSMSWHREQHLGKNIWLILIASSDLLLRNTFSMVPLGDQSHVTCIWIALAWSIPDEQKSTLNFGFLH